MKRHGARLGLAFPPVGSRAFRPAKITEPNSKGYPSAPDRRTRYRRAWMQAVRNSPEEGKWAISMKIPRIYDWLIRRDNKWLKANSPAVARRARRSVSQIDWQDRDARLAQDVVESAKELLALPGRPIRITKSAIAHKVGSPLLFWSRLPKLPMTRRMLEKVCETREAFSARRIRWVADSHREEDVLPTRCQLETRARVYDIRGWPAVKAVVDDALRMLASSLTHFDR